MPRGKKTDVKTKAKIAKLRITEGLQGTEIAKKTGVDKRTVQRVIENDVSQIVAESALIQSIISSAIESAKIMGEVTLNMAKDIKKRQAGKFMKPSTDEIRTLNVTVAEGFKRSQLLSGKETERVGITGYDIIKDIQSGKIKKDDAYSLLDELSQE